MGSISVNKKRMKKRRKTTNSNPQLVEEGDDAVASSPYNSEKEMTSAQSDDGAIKTDTNSRKAKKSGKKKKTVATDGQVELPEKGREVKAKKSGTKKKKHVADDGQVELIQKGIEGKAKKSGMKKKHVAADGQVELIQKGIEVKAKKSGMKKKKHVAAVVKVELPETETEEEAFDNNQVSPEDSSLVSENKPKKAHKVKRKDNRSAKRNKAMPDKKVETDDIYEISSEDEDDTKGMRKWTRQYHENRPGLEVLQQRIDDFVTEYWDQEEQERKDREAKAAEDGWTVVVHKKGGKKTADPESGVVVGSVNPTAVLEKMSQKKSKEVAVDFYRFQRREAQRNEVMKLQSKFEEDKKRIHQMRAARKFKPY